MRAEDVASIRCSECGTVWLPADEERWRAYLDCDDEIQVFCPECARLLMPEPMLDLLASDPAARRALELLVPTSS